MTANYVQYTHYVQYVQYTQYIAATNIPKRKIGMFITKKIFQSAKLENINKKRLIYYPHRHFKKYIFSNFKWVKSDFYTHK